MENTLPLTVENVESIKLTKNSKGYGWEIKILGTDIPRLQSLNDQLNTLYPSIKMDVMPE